MNREPNNLSVKFNEITERKKLKYYKELAKTLNIQSKINDIIKTSTRYPGNQRSKSKDSKRKVSSDVKILKF